MDLPLFFPALDIVRGFAAVTVVMYHVIEYTEWHSFARTWPGVWFRYGWMGVDIFFVLSGFVITLAALRGLAKTASWRRFAKQFMSARLARIVPLHYLTCFVYATVFGRAVFANATTGFWHILSHATFTHNLSPRMLSSINGVNWSLAVEMELYTIIMLLSGWLARTRPAVVVVCGTLIAWSWRTACFLLGRGRDPNPVLMTWYYTTNVLGNADFFAVGTAMAMIAFSRDDTCARRLFRNSRACLLTSLCILYASFTVLEPRAGTYWDLWPMVVFFRTLPAVGWGFMIAAFCGVTDARVLAHGAVRPLLYAGKVSYGVYLWHMMVVLTAQRLGLATNPPLTAVVTLAAVFTLASASWHLFEEPALKWARERVTLASAAPTMPVKGAGAPLDLAASVAAKARSKTLVVQDALLAV